MCKQSHEQQQQQQQQKEVSPTRNGHPEKLRTQQLKNIFITNDVFIATNHTKVSCLCQLRRHISLKIYHRPIVFEEEIKIWKNTEVSQNDKSVDILTSMGVLFNSTTAPFTLFSYSSHNSTEKGPS